MRIWKIMMVLACGLAVLANGYPFDEPEPAVPIPASVPAFSWIDVFKGPN